MKIEMPLVKDDAMLLSVLQEMRSGTSRKDLFTEKPRLVA